MLCGTGHPTHLARRLRIVFGPLAAVTGVWYHMGDDVAVWLWLSCGHVTYTPPIWYQTPVSTAKGSKTMRNRRAKWVGWPVPHSTPDSLLTTRLQMCF